MSKLEQPVLFDYAALDADTAAFVRESEGYIEERQRLTGRVVHEIGQRLIRVRDRLAAEDRFLAWLETAFGWKKSTAYNLMNVAAAFPNFGNELAPIAAFA
jgi:hypothetical protein